MEAVFFIFLSSGLFLGWSLGANDAANIFGAAVGCRMLKFRTMAIISSLFIILGAVFAGSGASKTLSELGSVNAIAGAFMVALSSAIAVYFMVGSGIPVSTSQAIVGGIIGWNFYSGKPTNIETLTTIVSSWIFCPIISALVSILTYLLIKHTLRHTHIHLLRQDNYIRILLIVVGAFGAYALGANNIANVMGVFIDSCPFNEYQIKNFTLNKTQILFLIGAISICIGIFTYSQKNIHTIGHNLMYLTPPIALIIVFSQAIVLFLFASTSVEEFLQSHNLPSFPLVPVSSSQAVIGAITGIALAKGGKNINWNLLKHIAFGWVSTPIISAIICFVSLFFLENVFNQTVFK